MRFKDFHLRPMEEKDLGLVRNFADKWIGQDYFEEKELRRYFSYSLVADQSCSYVAFKDEELVGIRLTFAPGNWIDEFSKGLTYDQWSVDKEKTAYFKSLFIAESAQGQGVGKFLSTLSMEALKNAEAIVCHSWLESPNNSSFSYLKKFGFQKVREHPLFWNHLEYECIRCTPSRCECSAVEMIKFLEES